MTKEQLDDIITFIDKAFNRLRKSVDIILDELQTIINEEGCGKDPEPGRTYRGGGI